MASKRSSWFLSLGHMEGYLSRLQSDEVGDEPRQGKGFDAYAGLMQRSFNEMHRPMFAQHVKEENLEGLLFRQSLGQSKPTNIGGCYS